MDGLCFALNSIMEELKIRMVITIEPRGHKHDDGKFNLAHLSRLPLFTTFSLGLALSLFNNRWGWFNVIRFSYNIGGKKDHAKK